MGRRESHGFQFQFQCDHEQERSAVPVDTQLYQIRTVMAPAKSASASVNCQRVSERGPGDVEAVGVATEVQHERRGGADEQRQLRQADEVHDVRHALCERARLRQPRLRPCEQRRAGADADDVAQFDQRGARLAMVCERREERARADVQVAIARACACVARSPDLLFLRVQFSACVQI